MTEPSGYECWAHLYDLFDRRDHADFYLPYAAEAGEVLEIGCGTGRITVPLAERGVHVYCVEPSPAMRRVLAGNLSSRPDLIHEITLTRGDAATFDLGRTFPAAFMHGVFDHFVDGDARRAALRNIHRHLLPGAVFLFDAYLSYEETGEEPREAGTVTYGGKRYRRLDRIRRSGDRRIEFTVILERIEGGRVAERTEETCLAGESTREEIRSLLAECGFRADREFRDFDRKPYRDGDPLLVVEATRL